MNWITKLFSLIIYIRWIVSHPVDSAIQHLNAGARLCYEVLIIQCNLVMIFLDPRILLVDKFTSFKFIDLLILHARIS